MTLAASSYGLSHMPFRSLLTAAALWALAPAALGQNVDIKAPRTETLAVTPPPGWVVSVWQGGAVELGEYTPPGQTGDRFVDLLGYSIVPRIKDMGPLDQADVPTFERNSKLKGCRQVTLRERQHVAGWFALQALCVGREGSANPERVELEFAISKVGREGVYRIWRSWRGTPAELSSMLRTRTGLTLAPVTSSKANLQVDIAALDEAITALLPQFEADMAREEICDLAAATPCKAFAGQFPEAAHGPKTPGMLVAGFYTTGLRIMPDAEFRQRMGLTGDGDGGPNRITLGLLPSELDWSDATKVQQVLTLVAIGQAADGGAFYIGDKAGTLSDAERLAIRAQVVAAARRLQRPDLPPNVVTIVIPPGR